MCIDVRCSGQVILSRSPHSLHLFLCVCVCVCVCACMCVSVRIYLNDNLNIQPISLSPLARSRPSKIPTHALFFTASNMLPITHTSLSVSFSFLSVLFFFFCTTTTSSQYVCMGAYHSCFSPVCRSKRR